MRPGKRFFAIGVAVVIGTTALSLVVAEGVLRSTGRYATATELSGQGYRSSRDFSMFRQPWVGFDSGRSGSFQVRQPEFSYLVKSNRIGVRDDEHPVEKAPGELRVAVLGDSFVASHGVAWSQAWTEVLEARLGARYPDRIVTVLGGGVPGHDPVFSYHLLRLRLIEYAPDVIVLAVNGSDGFDLAVRGGLDRFDEHGFIKPPTPAPTEVLTEHSHLARALLLVADPDRSFMTLERITDEEQAAGVTRIVDAAAAIAALGVEHGASFLLVMHPLVEELTSRFTKGPLNPVIEGAHARGLAAVNLDAWFRSQLGDRPPEEVYFPVDQHYNAAGYEILARGVEDALLRADLLPATEAPSQAGSP